MNIADVRANAFAMPLTIRPIRSGPTGSITANTWSSPIAPIPQNLRRSCRSRSRSIGDTVAYEFIRMPDSTGFGDYTESGQVIPVRFTTPEGRGAGGRLRPRDVSRRSLADRREAGFPGTSRRSSRLRRCARKSTRWWARSTTGRCAWRRATMGYKHAAADLDAVAKSLWLCQLSSSRSSRTSTARRGSASWSEYFTRGREAEGCLDRAGCPGAARPRTWRRWLELPVLEVVSTAPHPGRPDPRARQGHPRLSGLRRPARPELIRVSDPIGNLSLTIQECV